MILWDKTSHPLFDSLHPLPPTLPLLQPLCHSHQHTASRGGVTSPSQLCWPCQTVLSPSHALVLTQLDHSVSLIQSSLMFPLFHRWQTLKEESLALPAVNPLVTPQKGSTLDNSLHKDLLGAISGIGNALCSHRLPSTAASRGVCSASLSPCPQNLVNPNDSAVIHWLGCLFFFSAC